MDSRSSGRNDPHQLQHWVHRILLGGLVVSAALLLAGMVIMLVRGGQEASPHTPLASLLRDAARLNGPALTTLGLLVLMITPILRVVVLLIGWAVRRDWVFAAISLVVLALLMISLLLGVG